MKQLLPKWDNHVSPEHCFVNDSPYSGYEKGNILVSFRKGERVLVITECSKKKLGYTSSIKAPAKQMYQGRLFKAVKNYCEKMGFDYLIISAKYGLLHPDDVIEGYDMVLKTKRDIERIRPQVEEKLKPTLEKYEKIIVIAGKLYREVLKNLWDEKFITIESRGYGDLCSIINKATTQQK
jgi:cytoplasmic iron level regulating protein YaaA (DUF328/UPF0246 family)